MKTRLITLLVCLLTISSINASAQFGRPRTPGDTLTPVRILENGDAVFSIYAPKARKVSLTGDIMPWGTQIKSFEKDGVWSFIVPKPEPGVYRYSYVVDGVKVIDPRSSLSLETTSIATIAPKGDEFFAKKNVPHGSVAQRFYYSSKFNTTRRMHIWTPAGYEKGKMKLPVLYLIHGGGDNDMSWSTAGAAGDILDNLMAEGKMKPCIVVMPNGSVPTMDFVDDLVDCIIPYIEDNYNVKTGSANRALAGLSMGGLETMETMLLHYDKFSYFWVMSAGWFENDPKTMEVKAARLKEIAADFNKKVKLCVFSQGGKSDIAYYNCLYTLKEGFDANGVKYEKYLNLEGDFGHSWTTWRRDLNALMPRLF
ncbi:MAG: endo-1,4-beta-xylanase Z [Bacteroidales bacterium]|nr:endo-1,4-beta-xylanase Z [Bacteroidales bacterium]